MALAFAPSIGVPSCHCMCRGAGVCERPNRRLTMAAKGFGKQDERTPKAPSDAAKARDAAGARLENMRTQNAPEYSIWLRITDVGEDAEEADSPEFPWLPVGSICIPRNERSVSRAIFNPDVFEDLMSGARRLFPQLKNYTDEQVEIGFMPKDAPDEDDMSSIVVAKPEKESWLDKVQGGIGSLFKK